MENITPSLACLYSLRRSLAQGLSLKEAIQFYITEDRSAFASAVAIWMNYYDSHASNELPELQLTSEYQRAILICLEAGMQGQPIQSKLEELSGEAESASLLEVEEFISRLPVKALLPVFLFQFPAFLLLIFGPVLTELMKGVQ